MAPKRKNARTMQDAYSTFSDDSVLLPSTRKAIFANRPPSSDILVQYGISITFSCAEQSYMFCKALYFGDAESCRLILATTDPAEQKKQGKRVKGFNDDEWDVMKSRVARVGNWFKFTDPDNTHMREVLLGTEDKELAEAGRRDRVWGIGYLDHEAERYRQNWGSNKLGKALMAVRTRIREVILREQETGVLDDWIWHGGAGDEVDDAELRVWTRREEEDVQGA